LTDVGRNSEEEIKQKKTAVPEGTAVEHLSKGRWRGRGQQKTQPLVISQIGLTLPVSNCGAEGVPLHHLACHDFSKI